MPDPASLPTELFDLILECLDAQLLWENVSDLPWTGRCRSATYDLYASSLVSRKWYAQSTPILYREFHWGGRCHEYRTLLRFVHTITTNAFLAKHVRILKTLTSPNDLNEMIEIDGWPADQKVKERQEAAQDMMRFGRQVGYQDHQLKDAMSKDLASPLIVILVNGVPNVVTLQLKLHTSDRGHDERLLNVIRQPHSLKKLENLLLGKVLHQYWRDRHGVLHMPYPFKPHTSSGDGYSLDHVNRLPQLHNLGLADNTHLDKQLLSTVFNNTKASNLKHITIALKCRKSSEDERIALKHLLTSPSRLVSLRLRRECNGQVESPPGPLVYHQELVDSFTRHAESFECLELYDCHSWLGLPKDIDQTLHEGLHELKHLKALRIQADVLLGQDSASTHRMKSLPSSSETLALFGRLEK